MENANGSAIFVICLTDEIISILFDENQIIYELCKKKIGINGDKYIKLFMHYFNIPESSCVSLNKL